MPVYSYSLWHWCKILLESSWLTVPHIVKSVWTNSQNTLISLKISSFPLGISGFYSKQFCRKITAFPYSILTERLKAWTEQSKDRVIHQTSSWKMRLFANKAHKIDPFDLRWAQIQAPFLQLQQLRKILNFFYNNTLQVNTSAPIFFSKEELGCPSVVLVPYLLSAIFWYIYLRLVKQFRKMKMREELNLMLFHRTESEMPHNGIIAIIW